MNKKERMQKDIEDALKHEDNLQHDENEDPVTFVNSKKAKDVEHDKHMENDEK